MAEVQPYQFEPIFAPGETSGSENSDQSDEHQPEKYARHRDEAVSWFLVANALSWRRRKSASVSER